MAATPPSAGRERRHDIDALRILATLLLIFFHTARAFDEDPWHVKNDEVIQAMSIFVQFISVWHMPLFFILAGAGSQLALRYRTGRQFLAERVRRLFVPLLFGIVLLVPPQVYLERLGTSPLRDAKEPFQGTFLQFLPHFFQGIYPEGNLSWHHLWFILYLFIFSLLMAPLFVALRDRDWGRRFSAWFGALVSGKAGVLLLSLPIVVIWVGLYGIWPPHQQTFVGDWARDLHYLVLFLYGYLITADARCTHSLVESRRLTLGLALLLTVVVAMLRLRYDWPPLFTNLYFVVYSLTGLVEWCWLSTILGYGARYLNVSGKAWRWAGEIAYPFYMVHQTVIVVLAFYVVQWPLPIALKFLLISLSALVASVGLCELLKLWNFTRFMFGMKSLPRTRSVAQPTQKVQR